MRFYRGFTADAYDVGNHSHSSAPPDAFRCGNLTDTDWATYISADETSPSRCRDLRPAKFPRHQRRYKDLSSSVVVGGVQFVGAAFDG
ncbi:hypothetical protein HPP92_028900 [Vanilla planifolia]|uniref:Uncharacterized protein n=1 Tax=Vanilla planifolia TaxID=51239 RepID=A0A835U2C1_VANPL|nr:hypothetical protein HPP92_028900 [Vanilla planifolia]KAG0446303.1 hypothetical protein HPP92_028890 [Vanilla planifolia]